MPADKCGVSQEDIDFFKIVSSVWFTVLLCPFWLGFVQGVRNAFRPPSPKVEFRQASTSPSTPAHAKDPSPARQTSYTTSQQEVQLSEDPAGQQPVEDPLGEPVVACLAESRHIVGEDLLVQPPAAPLAGHQLQFATTEVLSWQCVPVEEPPVHEEITAEDCSLTCSAPPPAPPPACSTPPLTTSHDISGLGSFSHIEDEAIESELQALVDLEKDQGEAQREAPEGGDTTDQEVASIWRRDLGSRADRVRGRLSPPHNGDVVRQDLQTMSSPLKEIQVCLHRDAINTPWGFRLQGGKDFKAPLTVQRVSKTPLLTPPT